MAYLYVVVGQVVGLHDSLGSGAVLLRQLGEIVAHSNLVVGGAVGNLGLLAGIVGSVALLGLLLASILLSVARNLEHLPNLDVGVGNVAGLHDGLGGGAILLRQLGEVLSLGHLVVDGLLGLTTATLLFLTFLLGFGISSLSLSNLSIALALSSEFGFAFLLSFGVAFLLSLGVTFLASCLFLLALQLLLINLLAIIIVVVIHIAVAVARGTLVVIVGIVATAVT